MSLVGTSSGRAAVASDRVVVAASSVADRAVEAASLAVDRAAEAASLAVDRVAVAASCHSASVGPSSFEAVVAAVPASGRLPLDQVVVASSAEAVVADLASSWVARAVVAAVEPVGLFVAVAGTARCSQGACGLVAVPSEVLVAVVVVAEVPFAALALDFVLLPFAVAELVVGLVELAAAVVLVERGFRVAVEKNWIFY